MTIRTVLVVGAAGNAAGHVVTSLAEKEVRVRGFIRDAEKRQQVLRRGASEVAVGDLNRVEDVKAALSDVDAVFYVPPAFIDGEAELGVAFVELARAAGVRRFVFSSVIHPSLGLQNHAAKAPVEAALYDSGMEYAVFQPALFFQNYAAGWDDILRTGVLAERGRTKHGSPVWITAMSPTRRTRAHGGPSGWRHLRGGIRGTTRSARRRRVDQSSGGPPHPPAPSRPRPTGRHQTRDEGDVQALRPRRAGEHRCHADRCPGASTTDDRGLLPGTGTAWIPRRNKHPREGESR